MGNLKRKKFYLLCKHMLQLVNYHMHDLDDHLIFVHTAEPRFHKFTFIFIRRQRSINYSY